MRWAPLTLAEDDPGKFGLSCWLDYFKRTRSDAVGLNSGARAFSIGLAANRKSAGIPVES